MSYQIEITRGARAELEALPRDVQRRIDVAVSALATEPRGPGAVKLTGRDEYRVRVGDYRVIYSIDDAGHRVVVQRIRHRRDVYR